MTCVSIDIGSTPHLGSIPGAAEHATPVKPIDRLAERWERIMERVRHSKALVRFLTVGGGAAGVELTLSMRHRLRGLLQRARAATRIDVSFTLVTREEILASHNASVRRWFRDLLGLRGVGVVEHNAVERVDEASVLCSNGERIGFDELIWVTQAGAASWLADTGLELDEGGFIKIDATLRSLSDPNVFAAGDVASNVEHPRPKAGVFAVRQGPPLAANLRRALAGEAARAVRAAAQVPVADLDGGPLRRRLARAFGGAGRNSLASQGLDRPTLDAQIQGVAADGSGGRRRES